MNTKKIILTSIVIWIVGGIIGMLTCGWLFNWVYAIPPIIWKTEEAMLAGSNMFWSYLFGLMVAVIYVIIYAFLYKGLPDKGIKKGITYALIVWLVGAFSGIAPMLFYMTIAPTVVIYWLLQSLVLAFINGILLGVLYKK
ncbi:MAG: hypothetical protein ABID45_02900 [Patescibacteria group bacterium]